MKLRQHRGFSLLEVAVVLTIAGLVIAGVWLAAAQTENNNRRARLNRDVLQIVHNLKGVFANQSGAMGVFRNDEAVASGIFPGGWVIRANNGSGLVRHPFATDVSTASVLVSETGNNIALTLGSPTQQALALPSDACIELVRSLMLEQNFDDLGFVRVDVMSGSSTQNFARGDLPFQMARAANACQSPGTNQVRVTFDPF